MTAASAGLVIGVTGHRKIADPRRLAVKIDTALDELVRRAAGERRASRAGTGDDTPPLKLAVLSSLAEGADRLVAERVLAREGGELEAILPMAEADYEADFADEASRSEFRSLLARARVIRRLPGSAKREDAYAAAGRHVVDHCDVLVAVWDGKSAQGPGGTADIVGFARSRSRRLVIVAP